MGWDPSEGGGGYGGVRYNQIGGAFICEGQRWSGLQQQQQQQQQHACRQDEEEGGGGGRVVVRLRDVRWQRLAVLAVCGWGLGVGWGVPIAQDGNGACRLCEVVVVMMVTRRQVTGCMEPFLVARTGPVCVHVVREYKSGLDDTCWKEDTVENLWAGSKSDTDTHGDAGAFAV